MGKAAKALKTFIDGIPDSKITDMSEGAGTLHKDVDFRLDMQGVHETLFPPYEIPELTASN